MDQAGKWGAVASAEELMAVVGVPLAADAVRALIALDELVASSDSDLEEGEPVRSNLSGRAAGYELLCREGRVDSAFIFVVPSQGYSAYAGPLPGGLSVTDTREDVRRKFGIPERSGAAVMHRVLGQKGAWDRFVVGPLCVHFQYTVWGEQIDQVTIMFAENAPDV